jgi:FkbM family methyltransferase
VTPPLARLRRLYRKIRWEMVRGGEGRRERVLTVPTANGLLSFSNRDTHNGRALYVQREWELGLLRGVVGYLRGQGLIPPGADVVIDAGANIGMIAIAMIQEGHFREAVAIEPDPDNFAFLLRNIVQNGDSGRIHPVRAALGDSGGTVELERSEANFGDHRVRGETRGTALMGEENRTRVSVPLRTLDDVVESLGMKPARVGLVWVDVQGYEGRLFRGARRMLEGGAPVLAEVWPYGIRRAGMEGDDYVEIVRGLFDRVIQVADEGRTFEHRDPAWVAALFDERPRPEQNAEVIFIPKRRGAAPAGQPRPPMGT